MDGLVSELVEGARAEMAVVAERGGAVAAVPYMKTQLVESHRERMRRIETGELAVVGKNVFTEAEPSPLQEGEDGGILRVDPAVEASAIEALGAWRNEPRPGRGGRCPGGSPLGGRRSDIENIMPSDAGRGAGGRDHRRVGRRPFAPCSGSTGRPPGSAEAAAAPSDDSLAALRERVERVSEALGRRVKILVGKPGLDGHSNGAEQIAVRARDAGMDVVYEGIRLTPARIARTAVDEGVHVVGLSILSGSHARADPGGAAGARGGRRGRAGGGRRDHPPGRRGRPAGGGRGARVHAQGLRGQPHHGRHRGARGGASRRGRHRLVTFRATFPMRWC